MTEGPRKGVPIPHMKLKPSAALLSSAAAAALLLSGCSSIEEASRNYDKRVDIQPVVGSVMRVTVEREGIDSEARIAEFAYESAKKYCSDRGSGMMPLKGSASAAKPDGTPARAWLEFRCPKPEKVEREYKGITLHFDEFLEDEKK